MLPLLGHFGVKPRIPDPIRKTPGAAVWGGACAPLELVMVGLARMMGERRMF